MTMFLAVDIGNTHIAAGIFKGDDIITRCRIASDRGRTGDEFGILLRQTLEAKRPSDFRLDGAVVCSVVPGLTSLIERALNTYFDIKSYIVIPEDYERLGISVRYDYVEEVGADRVINSLAARRLYGAPAVVVDFGTATTFDIVDGDGAYIGGVIMPGPRVSAETLFSRAARLSPVPFVKPESVIGTSTERAIQAGIMMGTIDAVNGILGRIYEELGEAAVTIATGGLAEKLQPQIENIEMIDIDLTLKGLAFVYENVGKS
ncbi:MAG: type III pantothenate kinase [bacterium]|nr:type III pantothenate kinase [bacterium]